MSDWQPIETVPSDTDVDLWCRAADGSFSSVRVADCRKTVNGWATRGDYGWEPLADFSFVPTHWMPLPPPPTESHGLGEGK